MFKLGTQLAGDIIAPYFLPALYLAPIWIVLLFCNVIYVVNLASNQMSTLVASVCNAPSYIHFIDDYNTESFV